VNALRWLARHLYPLLIVVWANGLILRLSLRDSVDLLAPLYYLTPWPVLAVLTIPFLWTYRRQPKGVFGVIVIIHLFGGAWILESWRSGEPSKAPADFRVMHWNVSRPYWFMEGVSEKIRSEAPDLLAISEALPHPRAEHKVRAIADRWKQEFPGYAQATSGADLMCLVRGEILSSRTELLGPSSLAAIHEIRLKGRTITLVQVDLIAKPLVSRREPLTRLNALLEKLPDQPTIILGDFNTPRDSVHFDPIRQHWTNTFEAAGLGSPETWPMPMPVLSLDQVWVGKGLVPIRCRNGVSFRSDHRPVIADLSFKEPKAP
jgi:vancomycin resistance protein VanJ